MKKRVLSFVLAIILALVFVPGAFATPNPWPENDTPSQWAQGYVREAYNQNLVPSNLMGRFTQPITRAEFTHLAVALYETVTGTEITGRVTFTDTDDVNVQKMAYLDVVRGVGGNRFDPNGLLTREQAAAILVRLSNVLDMPLSPNAPTFADNDSISAWAMGYVGQMQSSGIMGGVGGNRFDPNGPYTIEQSITTMLRVFNMHFNASIPAYITIAGVQVPTSTTHLTMDGRFGIHLGVGFADGWIRIGRELTNADIQPLRYMVNLYHLGINDNNITAISPIAGLTNLRTLNIGNDNLNPGATRNNRITDFTPLRGLYNLERLYVNQLQITDLSVVPLRELPNLAILWAFGNNISDLSPLTGLTNLLGIQLMNNNIANLSPLAGLTNLHWLNLYNNPVSDWSPVSHVSDVGGRP